MLAINVFLTLSAVVNAATKAKTLGAYRIVVDALEENREGPVAGEANVEPFIAPN